MNVLQNLTELYNHLPFDSTYRGVAKGILEHLDEMQDVTVYDIAELTNSSRTTVQRMVQKMGYRCFSDFRYALQKAVQHPTYYNRILPKEQSREMETILGALRAQLQESSELFERVLSPQLALELVQELHKARKVSFYLPMHLYAVNVLQQTLAMGGKETAACCLLPDMLEDAASLLPGCIAVISTIEHVETLDMNQVFRVARERGATIWLASGENTMFLRYADRSIMPYDAGILAWNSALQAIMVALSECYRRAYLE